MIDERVWAEAGVCLVGGGDVCPEVLAKALKFAPEIVAADGGADVAHEAGLNLRAVIGDLDSISDATREALQETQVIEVTEQDTTDFEKCLSRIDAPLVIGVGFTGGRLDHTLAAMSTLAAQIGPPTLLLSQRDLVFAPRKPFRLSVAKGTRVSLFPMAPVAGRSKGLRWPIDSLSFAPNGRVGTSNIATGPFTLEFDQPGMLVILPAKEAASVVKMLQD